MQPLYILKRRTIGTAARNPYRPKGQVKYGTWVRWLMDAEYASIAAHFNAAPRGGLYDWAVFYRGKIVARPQFGRLPEKLKESV